MEDWTLPEGVTLEQLDAYARARENARRRADYARHPDRVERQRTTTYTNFLTKRGFVIMPAPPAPPWSELQEKCILRAVEASMKGGAACGKDE